MKIRGLMRKYQLAKLEENNLDFNLLKEISNLHNMQVVGKIEKQKVIQKILENKEGFNHVIGIEILLIVSEPKQDFIKEYPEFCQFLYHKIIEEKKELERHLNIWDSIKMVDFVEVYEVSNN